MTDGLAAGISRPGCECGLKFNELFPFKLDNVRVIPDAGDVEIVGADIIAKLSAQTSEDRAVAAWDQRIVIHRLFNLSPFSWP